MRNKIWKRLDFKKKASSIACKSKAFFANPYFRILLIIDVILVSFLYIGPGNLIHTYDGDYHIYRLSSSISAADDGQKILQLDPNQLRGFGQAPNLFYGPMLSWMLVVVFKVFSFFRISKLLLGAVSDLQVSLMFLMLVTTIITTFSAYFAAKKIFKSKKAGFFTALLFTLEPFHVGELLTRGSFSEYLAFVFIPIVILALYQIIFEKKTDFKRIFILAFSAFGVIVNHNLTAVLIAGMALLFIFFNFKKVFLSPKILLTLIFSGILTICFSSIFLLPFWEAKQVGIYNIFNPEFAKGFYSSGSTVSSADALLTVNMFNLQPGHASVVFGLSPVLLVSIIGFLVFRKDMKRVAFLKFSIDAILISLVFMFFASRFFECIPAVKNMHRTLQFSQRMLIIPAVLLPFVAGYFIGEKIQKKREFFIFTGISFFSCGIYALMKRKKYA